MKNKDSEIAFIDKIDDNKYPKQIKANLEGIIAIDKQINDINWPSFDQALNVDLGQISDIKSLMAKIDELPDSNPAKAQLKTAIDKTKSQIQKLLFDRAKIEAKLEKLQEKPEQQQDIILTDFIENNLIFFKKTQPAIMQAAEEGLRAEYSDILFNLAQHVAEPITLKNFSAVNADVKTYQAYQETSKIFKTAIGLEPTTKQVQEIQNTISPLTALTVRDALNKNEKNTFGAVTKIDAQINKNLDKLLQKQKLLSKNSDKKNDEKAAQNAEQEIEKLRNEIDLQRDKRAKVIAEFKYSDKNDKDKLKGIFAYNASLIDKKYDRIALKQKELDRDKQPKTIEDLLLEQKKVIYKYLNPKQQDPKKLTKETIEEFCKSNLEQIKKELKNNVNLKKELQAITRENQAARTLHNSQDIHWDKTQQGKQTSVIEKNGKQLLELKSEIKTENGLTFREIDFPNQLQGGQSGPLHLSFALQDEKGKNMPNKNAVFFELEYGKDGKLAKMATPVPVLFDDKTKIAYTEIDGKKYTMPVTEDKYKALLHEIEANKGIATDLSIPENAKDMVKIQQEQGPEKDPKQKPEQKEVEKDSQAQLAQAESEKQPKQDDESKLSEREKTIEKIEPPDIGDDEQQSKELFGHIRENLEARASGSILNSPQAVRQRSQSTHQNKGGAQII
jgi:hypothetical protein